MKRCGFRLDVQIDEVQRVIHNSPERIRVILTDPQIIGALLNRATQETKSVPGVTREMLDLWKPKDGLRKFKNNVTGKTFVGKYKTKSMTVDGTNVDEMFDFIKKMVAENNKQL